MKKFLDNWKTAVVGGVPAVSILFAALAAATDGNAATPISWPIVFLALGALGTAIFSKDA